MGCGCTLCSHGLLGPTLDSSVELFHKETFRGPERHGIPCGTARGTADACARSCAAPNLPCQCATPTQMKSSLSCHLVKIYLVPRTRKWPNCTLCHQCFRSFSISKDLFTTFFTSQMGRGKLQLEAFTSRRRLHVFDFKNDRFK